MVRNFSFTEGIVLKKWKDGETFDFKRDFLVYVKREVNSFLITIIIWIYYLDSLNKIHSLKFNIFEHARNYLLLFNVMDFQKHFRNFVPKFISNKK